MSFQTRKASPSDVPALEKLIQLSVRELQARDYTPAQLEGALATVYGVDTQLIDDGTYLIAETTDPATMSHGTPPLGLIVGCGGWSRRKTLYGGDRWAARNDELLDPLRDAAKFAPSSFTQRGYAEASAA